MAGIGGGLTFHRHGEAWSVIVWGRKRWFLFPPSDIQDDPPVHRHDHMHSVEQKSSIEWMEKEYPTCSPRPLECVQSAGDLLFIPFDYSHAVVALEETVGMSGLLLFDPIDDPDVGKPLTCPASEDEL
eukprot:gnl/MRDRNA2_/MRDRNA2_238259_c0_seq1.p1 gnl/MRDRNA2_/MRDRNA2_238259_c0~~gnl/MRDRNA2_/MRDRNA2_238259_c0_seq1.p1  ORF type:complete len:140 (-),score=14.02 gnl/MRDRNA2_/MRDRNA2_238259_c0_seq1:208-591(-)